MRARGEAFAALSSAAPGGGAALQPRYDACASWWTQVGITGFSLSTIPPCTSSKQV